MHQDTQGRKLMDQVIAFYIFPLFLFTHIRERSVLTVSLGPVSGGRVKDLFAEPDVLGSDLHQLVRVDELQGLLKLSLIHI